MAQFGSGLEKDLYLGIASGMPTPTVRLEAAEDLVGVAEACPDPDFSLNCTTPEEESHLTRLLRLG
jgi:hypothetical protein